MLYFAVSATRLCFGGVGAGVFASNGARSDSAVSASVGTIDVAGGEVGARPAGAENRGRFPCGDYGSGKAAGSLPGGRTQSEGSGHRKPKRRHKGPSPRCWGMPLEKRDGASCRRPASHEEPINACRG